MPGAGFVQPSSRSPRSPESEITLWAAETYSTEGYEPCSFNARKGMLQRFIFVNLWRSTYQGAQVSDTFGTRNAGQVPLEELVESQALSLDLREAVMACFCGGESRRWTVGELVERFKNLGVCASRASVTAALAELGLELELSGWAPWRLLERGTEWILKPKSELVALLSGVRRLPLKEAKILSEEHKAVLLVVIGYRRKGGVSKARVGEILGLEVSSYLDDLLSRGLIYCDPSRELNFWRPTSEALLALGLRSHTGIPALKELEEWFDTQKEMQAKTKLDPFFQRTRRLATRRLKRKR